MDEKDLYERGLQLRTAMFGREAVEKRMSAFGEFGKPLQTIINAYAYGDVWQRTALPPATKSLVMVAMMAGAGHGNELGVHIRGALKNGATAEQIQEVLLLLALYCGSGAGPGTFLSREAGGESLSRQPTMRTASRSMRCASTTPADPLFCSGGSRFAAIQ